MDMSLKKIAETYYLDGYNCAESLVKAGNDYYQLGLHDHDMILAAALGAGMQIGEICGALAGAACVLSGKYVKVRAHESDTIKVLTGRLAEKFREKAGGLVCRELKEQYFQEEKRCIITVEFACDALEEVVAEYEAGNYTEFFEQLN